MEGKRLLSIIRPLDLNEHGSVACVVNLCGISAMAEIARLLSGQTCCSIRYPYRNDYAAGSVAAEVTGHTGQHQHPITPGQQRVTWG